MKTNVWKIVLKDFFNNFVSVQVIEVSGRYKTGKKPIKSTWDFGFVVSLNKVFAIEKEVLWMPVLLHPSLCEFSN